MTTAEQSISDKAYEFWEAEGRPQGRDVDHWLRAEEALKSEVAPAKKVRAARPKAAAAKTEPKAAKKAAPAKPAKAKVGRRKA